MSATSPVSSPVASPFIWKVGGAATRWDDSLRTSWREGCRLTCSLIISSFSLAAAIWAVASAIAC